MYRVILALFFIQFKRFAENMPKVDRKTAETFGYDNNDLFSGNLLSTLTGKQNGYLNDAQATGKYYDTIDRILLDLNGSLDYMFRDISEMINSL